MRQPSIIRSRQEIIHEILAALEKSDLPRTKIMYRASLSYTQLKYYEDYLRSNGLVLEDDSQWTLTQKGKRYLDVCRLADEVLKMPSRFEDQIEGLVTTATSESSAGIKE